MDQPAPKFPDHYVIGCDMGQSKDPTAIAIIRAVYGEDVKDFKDPTIHVGRLQRLPLNTSYVDVASYIASLSREPHLQNAVTVIDFTGVGRPAFDLLARKGLKRLQGVSITSGEEITVIDGDGSSPRGVVVHGVPKKVLVSTLQALLHDGRLLIQKDLPETPALISELQDFRAEVTPTGYWKFGAREGAHDDLVLALAIAVWSALRRRPPMIVPPELLRPKGPWGRGGPRQAYRRFG